MTLSESETRVLGFFDPHTLMVDFREPDLDLSEIPYEHPDDVLSHVDESLLAHEFCHWLQHISTTGGIRALYDYFGAKSTALSVVAQAARVVGPRLPCPLVHRAELQLDLEKPDVAAFLRNLAYVDKFECAMAVRRGGFNVDLDHTPRTTLETTGVDWFSFARDSTVFGHQNRGRQAVARLRTSAGPAHRALGLHQLMESSARAVEIIVSGLAMQVDSSLVNRIVHATELPDRFDPYEILMQLYIAEVGRRSPDDVSSLSAHEMYAIADLAMMLETSSLGLTDLSQHEWLVRHVTSGDTGPVGIFFDLLDSVAEVESYRMPALGAVQSQLLDFQNALLRAYVQDEAASMRVLADMALRVLEECGSHATQLMLGASEAASLIHAYAGQALSLRLEEYDGAPIFDRLVTNRADLEELFRALVPTYTIGGVVRSYVGEAGTSLASSLYELAAVSDATSSVLFGNRPCALHVTSPRRCKLPVQELCHEFSVDRDHFPCPRGAGVDLLRQLGIEELQW